MPWIIFITALLLRLLYFLSLQGSVPHYYLFSDSFLYNYYAKLWAMGTLGTVTGGPIPFPAHYVAFLSGLYHLFGYHPFLPQLVQIVLGSLSCVLLYKIGKAIWNKEVGLMAGILSSFYGIFIFYDLELLKSCLANFFLITTFYLLLRKKDRTDLWDYCFSSMTFSAALLFREHLIVMVPAVVLWTLYYFYPKKIKTALFGSLIFLILGLTLPGVMHRGLSAILPLNPGLAPTAGIHFYIGNHDTSFGTYSPVPGVATSSIGHYRDSKKLAERSVGRALSQKEADRFWFQKGIDFIKNNPKKWLTLELKKLFLVFNAYEIPNDEDYPFARKGSWLLRLPLFLILSYGLILPLGILGIFVQERAARPLASLLVIFIGFYILILLATFVTAAYRLPLQPALLLFSAFALVKVKETILLKRYQALLVMSLALTGMILLVNCRTYLPINKYEDKLRKRVHFIQNIRYDEPAILKDVSS